MCLPRSVKKRGFPKASLEEVLSGSTKDADAKKPSFCLAVLRALAGLVSAIKSRLGDSESPDDCAWGDGRRAPQSERASDQAADAPGPNSEALDPSLFSPRLAPTLAPSGAEPPKLAKFHS